MPVEAFGSGFDRRPVAFYHKGTAELRISFGAPEMRASDELSLEEASFDGVAGQPA